MMATDYFSDYGTSYSPHLASSPTETPFYTPRLALSRRTSRYGTPSPGLSSSPPLPTDVPDLAEGDELSLLDPRRFTPTLHASLVSEILSLRRDLESKTKCIENLEDDLSISRTKNESLKDDLAQATKENRAAESKLEELERGTLSTLEDLAHERDELRNTNDELRIRLDVSQKKIRTQEEESHRAYGLWEKERKTWSDEKRQLERRVHVTEARLRTVIEELAAQEDAARDLGMGMEAEDFSHDSGLGNESDTTSVRSPIRRSCSRNGRHARNTSLCSSISVARVHRYSLQSPTGSPMRAKFNSATLADELVFDEDEEDLEELEIDSDDFPENEMRARRALESRQSMYQDDKAKRILGIKDEESIRDSLAGPRATSPCRSDGGRSVQTRMSSTLQLARPAYVDTGVQFSPPPSPQLPFKMGPLERAFEPRPLSKDIEANQRRKRISVNASDSPSRLAHQTPGAEPEKGCVMVSSSSQTIEGPPSPPETPKISTLLSPETPPVSLMPVLTREYCSTSTQTEASSSPEAKITLPQAAKRAPPPPIPIPSIAIHPPLSAPSSPKEPKLPSGTKNAECQTTFNLSAFTRSIAMQTEEILVDRRLAKLPPHLRPSAIRSRPTSLEPEVHKAREIQLGSPQRAFIKAPAVRPVQNVSATNFRSAFKVENRYPGHNDNGPLAYDSREILNRPFRTTSLFAGFDGASSDEGEEFAAAEYSDEEYRRAPSMRPSSRILKHSRPLTNMPTPVPEEREPSPTAQQVESGSSRSRASGSRRSSPEKSSRVFKPARAPTLTRQPSIRRAAMIQSGATAHLQQRSRTPSVASVESSMQSSAARPPFPVPTRSSSRKLPTSKSEGAQSPTPHSGVPGRRSQGRRQHSRGDSLRKVRSAAVIPRAGQVDGHRRTPSPQKPASPVRKRSPQLPLLPNHAVTSSTYLYSAQRFGHRSEPSRETAQTGTESAGSSTQQTSVVDAIAATMVGEWMWKYVRKRKSFGMQDSAQDNGQPGTDGSVNVTGNGVRHKRWVWLSPYERAVMWSSKQPTSESALLGKSGRKLTIQSVLDVKDNTPPPKNAGTAPFFDRSILILTPARALKFTAVSKERHYLWLTALSFLSHSSIVTPPLASPLPVVPRQPSEQPSHALAPTLGRGNFNKTSRITIEKPSAPPLRQQYSSPAAPSRDNQDTSLSNLEQPIPDSAEPPVVPRYGGGTLHGRKRSSTGPRLPPPPGSNFRSFSHTAVPSINSTTGSSNTTSNRSSAYNPNFSGRTSEASSSNRRSQNFFDAVGLHRMEAFVEPRLSEEAVHGPRSPAKGGRGEGGAMPRMTRRRGISNMSGSTNASWRNGGVYDDLYDEGFDPFRGF